MPERSQADRRARPFCRRRFRIFRPLWVAIRARNPSLRFRTRFEGWNVRLIVSYLPQLCDKTGQIDTWHCASGWGRKAAATHGTMVPDPGKSQLTL